MRSIALALMLLLFAPTAFSAETPMQPKYVEISTIVGSVGTVTGRATMSLYCNISGVKATWQRRMSDLTGHGSFQAIEIEGESITPLADALREVVKRREAGDVK